VSGLHDHPGIYPTLPGKDLTDSDRALLESSVGTVYQTAWEYRLSHVMTQSEGSAFWHGVHLAREAERATGAAS
jgi:hypothetical protein